VKTATFKAKMKTVKDSVIRGRCSCNAIGAEFGRETARRYNKEFRLSSAAFWVDDYLSGSPNILGVDYNESTEMLRCFLLGMFQDYIINHTSLLDHE